MIKIKLFRLEKARCQTSFLKIANEILFEILSLSMLQHFCSLEIKNCFLLNFRTTFEKL